jgi:serine/threonine-protein kinase
MVLPRSMTMGDDPNSSAAKPDGSAGFSLDAGLRAGFDGSVADAEAPAHAIGASVLHVLRKIGARAQRVILSEESEPEGPPLQRRSRDSVEGVGTTRRYHVLGEIGRGGVGVVLKGHDEGLGRNVAIKVLREDRVRDPALLMRFIEEAQIGGQLEHPGITPVYDLGLSADDRPYFSMRLVKGRTLALLLSERRSPLEGRPRFLSIFSQVCQTMAYAHSRGVIHRDLKPSNVMVGAFGEVQVVDWGLAKVLARERDGGTEPQGRSCDPATSRIQTVRSRSGSSGSDSVEGSVLGTPAYMPPEQARGELLDIDERADVFTLGAILCEILTGLPPFGGEKLAALESAAGSRLEAAIGALARCDADLEIVDLCRRCLAPEKSRRPRHAGIVANEVGVYLASVEERARNAQVAAAEARVKVRAERKQRRLALGLAASVVVSVLLGGGGWVWLERDRAARLRDTEQRVNVALSEATLQRGAKDFGAAVAAAGRAQALIETGASTAALRAHVENVATVIASEAVAFRQREKLDRENREFLARLQDMREPEGDEIYPTDWAQVAADYEFAFRDFGLAPLTLSADQAARVIRERGIEVGLSAALDEWADACRRASRHENAEHLLNVALAADTDESRTRLRSTLRQAIEGGTPESLAQAINQLKTFAHQPGLRSLPPATLNLLGRTLGNAGAFEECVAVYRLAQRLHPSDFALNVNLGRGLLALRPPKAEEAIGFYRVALALRPASVETTHKLLLALGDVLNDLPSAVEEAREAIGRFPHDAHLRWHLGIALFRSGDRNAAIAEFREAIRLKPDDARAYANLGRALGENGDHEGATAALREVIRLRPKDAGAHHDLGVALQHTGDQGGAIAAYREAIHLDPDAALSHLSLGRALHGRGDLEGAMVAIREAVRLKPDDARAHHSLGLVLTGKSDLAGATTAFREAIRLAPNDAAAHNDLGIVLRRNGDQEGAIEAYREAIRLDADCVAAHCNLGDTLSRKGDREGAIAAFRAASQLMPDDAGVHHRLGLELESACDHECAAEAFRKVTLLEPDNAGAHYNLGTALSHQGAHADAIVAFRRAIDLDPDYAAAHGNLAVALEANGNYEQAIAEYHEGMRCDPSDARTPAYLARLRANCPDPALRDADEAVALAERAVALSDQAFDGWLALGAATYRVDHWERAVEALERALELQPEDPGTAFFLSMSHWQLLHEDDARAWFDKAVYWMENSSPAGSHAHGSRSPGEEAELRRIRTEAAELLEIEDKDFPEDAK